MNNPQPDNGSISNEYYYLRAANSRYVGMYSKSELQAGFDSDRFQSDWTVTKKRDGEFWSQYKAEQQGPWTPLGFLLEKSPCVQQPGPESVAVTAVPPVLPPPLPAMPTRGWAQTPGLQRWSLTAKETTVRVSPGETGAVLAVLGEESEVDFIKIEKVSGQKWCRVKLASGQDGYVPGSTAVRLLQAVCLNQPKGQMWSAPELESRVVRSLAKGDAFLLVKTVKTGSKEWVRIRDTNGQEGFIEGTTNIINQGAAKPGNSPGQDMLIGGLWCVGGILVTLITYSMASERGGTYLVTWGAILFGGIQFLKGAFNSITSSPSPTPQWSPHPSAAPKGVENDW